MHALFDDHSLHFMGFKSHTMYCTMAAAFPNINKETYSYCLHKLSCIKMYI